MLGQSIDVKRLYATYNSNINEHICTHSTLSNTLFLVVRVGQEAWTISTKTNAISSVLDLCR